MRRRRALALDLLDAALASVDPVACTQCVLRELKGRGELRGAVTVLAFGKAARGMAEAALGELSVERGLVIGPTDAPLGPLEVVRGGHPTPSPDAAQHGQAVLDLARSLGQDDTALVLVSGGGSAMLELPRPGVTVSDIAHVTEALLKAGADIGELNTVRRALSLLKGGKLALALAPARVVNVVLSDVVGSPLEVIASGPTVAPRQTAIRALDVVRRYGLEQALSQAVLRALASQEPPTHRSAFAHVKSMIAADNITAQKAVAARARALGLPVVMRSAPFQGEARELAPRIVAESSAQDAVFVAGGETTVTVRGRGLGGRNQELALACLPHLERGTLVTLATDGVDGNSPAAGALIDEAVIARAKSRGVDVAAVLARSDAHRCLEQLGATIYTGPTGTNVADLFVYVPTRVMDA